MNRGTQNLALHSRFGAALLLGLAISGCTSGQPADSLTLAETKSPAQLLRNEIAGRLPAELVLGDVEQSDASEGCDSDGFVRSWRSTALLAIAPSASAKLERDTDVLVESLVSEGWEATTRDSSARLFEHRLTKASSSAEVRITADTGAEQGEGASVLIVVNGPCVVTDGPDSEEVMTLENR